MIKIEITKDCGTLEVSGNRDDVIIDAGFAMFDCIRILRKCGKSNTFIEGLFRIALEHKEGKENE